MDVLYVFLEGPDDSRFCEYVLRPNLASRYPCIRFIEYADTPPVKVTKLIKSLRARNEPYMFLHDRNGAPCVTKRKEAVLNKYRSVEETMLYIVVTEIESWYLAGVPKQLARASSVTSRK